MNLKATYFAYFALTFGAAITLAGCGSDAQVDIDTGNAGDTDSVQMTDDMKDDMKDGGSDQMNDMASQFACGNTDHPSVGKTMVFSTNAHDVSGSAQIIDNCTIRVSAFNYDGGGPAVYFYAGVNGEYRDGSGGFAIGPKLNGTVYSGDSIEVTLTSADKLDKLNGISVWCADFNVSFGDGLFM